jgi:hypothetical protein
MQRVMGDIAAVIQPATTVSNKPRLLFQYTPTLGDLPGGAKMHRGLIAIFIACNNFQSPPPRFRVRIQTGGAGIRMPGIAQIVHALVDIGDVAGAHQRFGRRRQLAGVVAGATVAAWQA